MGFKTSEQYRKDKYGSMLVLPNDQDYADIVLLYTSVKEVLLADVHYIRSAEYDGYVHCLGPKVCPACNHITAKGNKGIRIQPKLFIPLYNVMTQEIMFFDRSTKFESQLLTEVFANYPNPSDYVFRLTRHGGAGDIDTYYTFMAVSNNTVKPFDDICKEFNITLPGVYNSICRDVDAVTLKRWLTSQSTSGGVPADALPSYTLTPRAVSEPSPSIDALDDIVDDDLDVDDCPEFA